MERLFLATFVVTTVLQATAISAGLDAWWGLDAVLARPLALATALVPFFGAAFGIIAAVDVWDWGFVLPLLVFGSAQLLLIALLLASVPVPGRPPRHPGQR